MRSIEPFPRDIDKIYTRKLHREHHAKQGQSRQTGIGPPPVGWLPKTIRIAPKDNIAPTSPRSGCRAVITARRAQLFSIIPNRPPIPVGAIK
jgi:hypothetical protein